NNFPFVKDSSDKLGRLVTKLKKVIGYQHIAKHVLENNFEKTELEVLLNQTDNALLLADRKLAEVGPKKRMRYQPQELEGEPRKKVKTGSSTVNLVDFFTQLEMKGPQRVSKAAKETKFGTKEMDMIIQKHLNDPKQLKEAADKRKKKPTTQNP